MKIFTRKGILQKTVIGILIVLSFNFIVPTYSRADIGGVLVAPIVDLVATLGDVVINLLQRAMTGEWGAGARMSTNPFMVNSDEYFAHQSEYEENTGNSVRDGGTVYPDNAKEDGGFDKGWLNNTQKYQIPIATYSPEQIFAGTVSGLDINFISPNETEFGTTTDKDGNEIVDSAAGKLQSTIAQWYVALRNLAVVGLLSVLVYVGIRMILSSTAGDKAKYKQMFTDWLVALCLVFFLHYIMSFVLTMVESISYAISGGGANSIQITVVDGSGTNTFKTNLLGEARFKTQYADISDKLCYLILYIILVGYTCVFTWMYLKRLLMMAFLTIIAPLVALTYPIDKISDGSAQAFNAWLKEYVYNALLQPFHLIIYTVLVSSAFDLVQTNPIYMIAAIGFLIPAEKILRNIFGFNKAGAGTVGALTGAAAAGAVASKLFNKAGSKISGGKGNSGGGSTENAEKPPRFSGNGELNSIAEEAGEGQERSEAGQNAEENNPEVPPNRRLDGNEQGGNGAESQQNNPNRSTDAGTNFHSQDAGTNGEGSSGNNPQPNNPTENSGRSIRTTDKENMRKKIGRGVGRVFTPKRGTHRKLMQLKQNPAMGALGLAIGAGKKTLKLANHAATTAAGALVGGTVGLVGGIIAGNGVTGMLAGAAAGAGFGNKLGGQIDKVAGNAVTRFQQGYYGEKEYARRKRVEDFQSNKANWEFARQQAQEQLRAKGELGENQRPSSAQVQAQMEKMTAYVNKGFTNPEEIARLQRAEQFDYTNEESARAAAYAKKAGYQVDDKNVMQTRNAMIDDFRNTNKGLTQQQAEAMADRQIDILRRQQGYGSVNRGNNLNPTPQTFPSRGNRTQVKNKAKGKGKGKGKK